MNDEATTLAPEAAGARRVPSQRRSRERVERILEAATALIARSGSDALRTSEVAEQAGISIGSLYQYFPDKGAIIRALAERYHALGRACIAEELAVVVDAKDLAQAFDALIDTYYGIFLVEPVMRDIWSGTQADKALHDIDLANSRENGAMLAATIERLRPDRDRAAVAATAFLVMHLGEAAMRLAVSVPRDEGDRLIAAYKRMALRELALA